MRIQTLNKSWYVGLVGTGVLALLAIAMLCPMTGSGVQAADCTTNNPANCPTQSMSTQASVNVAPTIALALQDTIDIDVSPTVDGSFGKTTANLAVSTNSNAGYSVYLQAVDGDTLKNPSSINSVINPVTPDATQANFGDNTWGYNLGTTAATDSTVYQPVPSTQTVIDTTDAPTDKNYNFTLATKVDTSLPSGPYTNTITVSAVANPQAVGLMTITNMQDMTSALCNVSEVGDTKQLVDMRDGKKYWVAKLKDGNCWMTQNLALDITTAGLKASDTDITADVTHILSTDGGTGLSVTEKGELEAIIDISGSSGWQRSWSFDSYGAGQHFDYIYATPIASIECATGGTTSKITDMGQCRSGVGMDVVAIPAQKDTFQAQEGTYSEKNTYIAVDESAYSFDAHYLIGNYYSWYAATAGTGYGIAAQNDAPGSICPKGWQLPSIGSADGSSETKKTFGGLYTKYDGVDARKLPLSLVAGGYVDVDYDQGRSGSPTLGSVGVRGNYWSSTANYPNNGGAFYMRVGSSGVDTYSGTYDSNLYDGYFVRCVAR